MAHWNPWHGCVKISSGCNHCYVYQKDAEYGKNAAKVRKTAKFDLPIQKKRGKEYKLAGETVVSVCVNSDFFLKGADARRQEAWAMMRQRPDLHFIIATKRMHRVAPSLPDDWGEGYENVTIFCSVESQSRADERLPLLLSLPAKHRGILAEPLLESLHIEKYLEGGRIEQLICGGEYGEGARVCDFAWVLELMNQCVQYEVPFHFQQTGSLFQKGERRYRIAEEEQKVQAARAGVDFPTKKKGGGEK